MIIFGPDFQMLLIVSSDVHVNFSGLETELLTVDGSILDHICFFVAIDKVSNMFDLTLYASVKIDAVEFSFTRNRNLPEPEIKHCWKL